jgi:hypothetical protein
MTYKLKSGEKIEVAGTLLTASDSSPSPPTFASPVCGACGGHVTESKL